MKRLLPRLIQLRPPRRATLEAELRDELDTHLAMWTDHYMARGIPRDEAERQARARIGSMDVAIHELYDSAKEREDRMQRRDWWTTIHQDVLLAIRQALRAPAFTIAALITFALGIGANTAMYSVVRGVLLRPLPFRDPARLAAIWPTRMISIAELLYMQQHATNFQSVAAFSPGWGVAMTGAGEPTQLDAARVSTNFFDVLGVRPALGRGFAPDESESGKWNVAVLSHELWIRQFAGDSGVIGRIVGMDTGPFRIIGVMPAGFEAFQSGVDAWLPLQVNPSSPFFTGAIARAFGRLTARSSLSGATAQLATVAPRMREAFNYTEDYAQGATVVDLHESIVGGARQSLLVLIGAVALLVVISVTNVGTLMLVHTGGRGREFAIRRALGASRPRVIGQLLTQGLVLAVAGGLLGLATGALALRVLKGILPATLPMLARVTLDSGVVALSALVTIGAGIGFAVAPALFASRVDPEGVLRAGASPTNRGHARMRRAMVVLEIALAVVLVISAGLMAESLWRLNRLDLGFDAHRVLTLRLQPSGGRIKSTDEAAAYFSELVARIAAIPNVEKVGAAQHLPLSGFNWLGDLEIEGHPLAITTAHPRIVWRSVVGDYFGTMHIPLVRGRLFTSSDRQGSEPVIIIDNAMAKRYWPDRDPIGERIKVGLGTQKSWATVVGIVGDVRSGSTDQPPPDEVYCPNEQQGLVFMHFVIRTRTDPLSVVSQVRTAVRSFDQTVPIAEVQDLDALVLGSSATRRTIALLLETFAALALILGTVGIYGVISHGVSQRTREIGIRAALGGADRLIAAMVIGEGVRLASLGCAVGIAAAFVVARSLRTLVFGVSTADPLVYAAVATTIVIIAVIASFLPARRAAGIDPLAALKSD
jgi:predicted permease